MAKAKHVHTPMMAMSWLPDGNLAPDGIGIPFALPSTALTVGIEPPQSA
jgi:hypothetical protein